MLTIRRWRRGDAPTAPTSALTMEERAERRSLWTWAGVILTINSLLVAWLLLKPAPHDVVVAIDDLTEAFGAALCLPMAFFGGRWRQGMPHIDRGLKERWAPRLIGLGAFGYAVGTVIWTYYQVVIHQPPFPSWADAGYLGFYPFLMIGILLLPTHPLPSAARVRMLLDGLMIMTAMVTFSWRFNLGPTVLQGGESLLARIVGTAYPLWDLVLLCCLFLLASRTGPQMRRAVSLLCLGLALVITSDTIYDIQGLQSTYAPAELLDAGWPLGFMLVGLGAHASRWAIARGAATAAPGQTRGMENGRRRLVWSFLPFALVPAVGGLLLYDWLVPGTQPLRLGIVIGGAVLIALVLLRQVMALLENSHLYARLTETYHRLDDTYRELEARNRDTVDHARRMESLNAELQATQDELRDNNRALLEANQRLEAMVTTDPLTGLPNHRSLVTALDQEIERSHRYERACAILFLDIDHFKALNDGFGHSAGDAVLQEFAATVRAELRGLDTVGRWGGEEFMAILPETDQGTALALAERLRAAVAARTFTVGGGMHLTCSIGVAAYPRHAATRDGIVDAADTAMYAAKHLGRNQARTADDPAIAALGDGTNNSSGSREEAALIGTVEALSALVEARDHYTGEHTAGVADLSIRVALALGLDAQEARMIGLAARLHDIGKIAVPDAILRKAGQLTAEEWLVMTRHPVAGADVVSRVPALRGLAPVIRAHHERWNGTGYPDGLREEAIPLAARIIAVADAYGAMTTDRPYRAACSPADALAELLRCAGTQFDPRVTATAERVLSAEPAARKANVA